MSSPIVVLGSNSISGASFVDHLLEKGEAVIGLSRSPEPIEALLPYKMSGRARAKKGSFRFEQLDLNRDTDRIVGAIEEARAEYVVNFAAQSMVAESWQHPEHWYQTNVVANVRLHNRLRQLSFIKKYVHVSTPEVYGSCSGNVTEEASFNPSTPYAASRAACDLHLQTFFKQYQFPVVYTRAANVYGPGQQLYRIIPRTILFIRLGKKLQLHGGGHSVRSFIHLRDVSDGTERVMRDGKPGQAYHLSTTRFISIRDLVEMICGKMKVDFKRVVDVVDERPGKDAAYLLDATRARRDLGWKERVELEPGIDEMVAWVDRYLDALRNEPHQYIHKP